MGIYYRYIGQVLWAMLVKGKNTEKTKIVKLITLSVQACRFTLSIAKHTMLIKYFLQPYFERNTLQVYMSVHNSLSLNSLMYL